MTDSTTDSTTARRFGRPSGVTSTNVQEDEMTTTMTRTTTAIAVEIDLDERFMLDRLLTDDAAIVDLWDDEHDGEAMVTLIGDEHAVVVPAGQFDTLLERVQTSSVLGWGREMPLPDVEVFTLDGERPDLNLPEASIFIPAKRERFATYRLIERVL